MAPPFQLQDKAQEIIALYQSDERPTLREIGLRYGCERKTISRLLRRHGIVPDRRKRRGNRSSNWRGGCHLDSEGYVRILLNRDDPYFLLADKQGYVLEHRLVMARSLGRLLTQTETIHHINGDRSDNRIENLEIHQGNHGTGVRYVCNTCGSHDVEPTHFKVKGI